MTASANLQPLNLPHRGDTVFVLPRSGGDPWEAEVVEYLPNGSLRVRSPARLNVFAASQVVDAELIHVRVPLKPGQAVTNYAEDEDTTYNGFVVEGPAHFDETSLDPRPGGYTGKECENGRFYLVQYASGELEWSGEADLTPVDLNELLDLTDVTKRHVTDGFGLPYGKAYIDDQRGPGIECPVCGRFIPEQHDQTGERITNNYALHFEAEAKREAERNPA